MNSPILAEADALIVGQRAADYGSAQENFMRIAALWSIILSKPVSSLEVVLCMQALKISRQIGTGYHRDSMVDIAGYAALGAQVAGHASTSQEI